MRLVLPMLLVVAGVGCGGAPTEGDLVIEPISIDTVDVVVQAGTPAAHVTVSILRQRPRDAICTQIARLYDDVIRLEGSYPAGGYLLRVNGVERPFTAP